MTKHVDKKNYKSNNVFKKTFAILIAFSVVLILTANYVVFTQSTQMLRNQTYNANLNMLTKTNDALRQIFNQMDQVAIQMSLNPKIINALVNPDIKQYARNNDIINDLRNIGTFNEYISSLYIYVPFNGLIFSTSGGVFTLNGFYDKRWAEAHSDTPIEKYAYEDRMVVDYSNNLSNCITVLRGLPYGAKSSMGRLVINLDAGKIYQNVTSDAKLNGELYIVNSKGIVVFNKDEEKFGADLGQEAYMKKILDGESGIFTEKVNGQEMTFFYVTDPDNQSKCIYSVPLKEFGSDKATVIRILLINTLICIALSLILSFFITKGIYKPVQRLVNLVLGSYSQKKLDNEKGSMNNEYEFLSYAYSDVIDRNKSIEDFLESVRPAIKDKLYLSLISGKDLSEQEISEKLNFLNMNFDMTQLAVIVLQIDNYKDFLAQYTEIERNLYKLALVNKVEEIINTTVQGTCVEVEEHMIAAIISFNNGITLLEAKKGIISIAGQIHEKLRELCPFTVTLGIGGMYRGITEIRLSYLEAKNALNYKLYLGENSTIDIEDVKLQSEELYYFYSEKEKMLINNIKLGLEDAVEEIINTLFEEIQNSGSLPYNYVQQIVNKLISSLIELIIDSGMTIEKVYGRKCDLYEEFIGKETLQDIKTWFTQICSDLIRAINNINLVKQHKYVQKVKEYVENNLSSDISLNDVADYVGLNSAYLSKLFKDNFGKNFIDYLNKTRIDKAKLLLENTQLSIKEVGFRVGFNTVQNFMRVFRKYEGVTPGQFRDLYYQ